MSLLHPLHCNSVCDAGVLHSVDRVLFQGHPFLAGVEATLLRSNRNEGKFTGAPAGTTLGVGLGVSQKGK